VYRQSLHGEKGNEIVFAKWADDNDFELGVVGKNLYSTDLSSEVVKPLTGLQMDGECDQGVTCRCHKEEVSDLVPGLEKGAGGITNGLADNSEGADENSRPVEEAVRQFEKLDGSVWVVYHNSEAIVVSDIWECWIGSKVRGAEEMMTLQQLFIETFKIGFCDRMDRLEDPVRGQSR